MGAVTGAQDFLKTVANAKINPPMDPRIARPAACSGERDVRFQAQAAVPIAKINNSPVLLTVPVRVIVLPRAMPSLRKVLSFNVGFEVRIRFAIRALLEQTIVASAPLWMTSVRLGDHANLFQRFQIFNHHVERDRAILGGDCVADLLCVAFSINEVQRFIRVLFTCTPKPVITHQFWCGDARLLCVILEVVITKDGEWPLGLRITLENEETVAGGLRLR